YLLWDERVYHIWAIKIANGTYKSSSFYGFAPLPAYFMALVYKIFSPDILYIRIMNIIFGVLTCYLVYLIGKQLVNRTTGLFACLIAALYKPFIFYSIVPLKTSLSVFLFASTVYLFLAILNKNSMIKLLLLGIAIGLMLNVRPNCIVVIPFLPLVILWNIYKGGSSLKVLAVSLVLYIAGLSISISPFTIRNYMVSGEFKLTTRQSGYALYMANNLENLDPYFRPVPCASPSPFEQGLQLIIEASRRVGKKLSSREASSYWTRETMKMALERPEAFMWKICQKTLVLFNQFEAGDHYHIGFVSDFVKFFRFPFFSLWLVLPLGMAGIATTAFRSRKLLGISLIFVFYASTLVVFFTSTRFRLPLLVILIPFAVMGMQDLFSHIKNRQVYKIAAYSAIVLLFVVVEFLPVQATDDMTPYYNTHATILSSKELGDEAIQYWEKSSRMDRPGSSYANLSLAGEYVRKGDTWRARHYLDKIPDASFAAAYKYDLIGDISMHQGQIKTAITAYEKSLEINSGRRGVRRKLVRIYWRIDKKRALQEYEKFEYISSFYKRIPTP
ncbi:MAG: tetratricopeptide repeat protein, partial [Desulfobacteraceae bacterium]|nr:tetratricopeptide repeat protein [Desulfobacteraceae bacterium]